MSLPALRFKEFAEAWDKKNLLELSNGGFTNGVFNDPTKVGRGYKLVNVLDMYIESTIDETRLSLVDIPEAEFLKNKVETGDIFFTRSSLVKEGIAHSNTYLGNSQDITFDGHLIRLRPRKDLIHSTFLNYLLKTSKARAQLIKRGKTATMTTIGQADIASVEVLIPAKEEQTKIANFLSVVDEKITQLTQKCELLAQYKKGVLQQIFSQELRFKNDDGQDFPEWEECEFGKAYEFIPTNSYSREMLTYEGGDIQNIHYGDIHTRYKSNFKQANENVPFLSSEVDVSKIKESQFCRNGDIVIADASEDYADVGKAIEVIEVGSKRLVAGLHTYIARNMNNKLALGFGGYLMQSSHVRSQIKVLATGVSVLSISKGNLAKVNIKLPCKAEQAKIASLLTTIDDKLTHTHNQLVATKQYKQGLLQQMFV